MKIPIWTVDAFTSKPFSGNPAAVCLLEQELPDDLKQNIAAEMNISETCFVTKQKTESFSQGEKFGLRWFTPTNEVPLCGHATLAAATVLYQVSKNCNPVIKFDTLSGVLEAKKKDDKVVLDLPLNAPEAVKQGEFCELVTEVCCGLPVQEVLLSRSTRKLLIRLADNVTMEQLQKISPAISRLTQIESSGRVAGVILTAKNDEFHFISRYFAPWNGIPEDPVTGSAHTVLAPYWAAELGLQKMVAKQCSPRGGVLDLALNSGDRIEVAGQSVIVMEGFIMTMSE